MPRNDCPLRSLRSLYFTPHQIWPVNTGARLRNYQLARWLGARSAVTIVEMRRRGERQNISPAESDLPCVITLDKDRPYTPSKVLRGLAGPTPVTVLNCWSLRLASQLAEVLRLHQFDTVQIGGVHLMEYLPIIEKAAGPPAVVVDWHNIESELMWRYAKTTGNLLKRAVARRTAKLIESAEDRLLESCVTHTVTSERERQKLLARRPGANIRVMPNGVDAGYYSVKKIGETCKSNGRNHSKPTILFVGSMDYHANIDAVTWFSRTAWPEVARIHPYLELTIVGRNPSTEVRALASDRIHVTGTVDDVRPFYSAAVAAVVPLRSGSGTRIKILEAMAAGVPVVSTRLGAEGLDVEDNVHILLADSAPQIASALHRLASSHEIRSQLSDAARALAYRVYDWSVIGKRLYQLHAELAESRAPRVVQKVS